MLRLLKGALAALALTCLAACGGATAGSPSVYGSVAGGTPGATFSYEAIAYGNGIYVATGQGGLGSNNGDSIGAWVATSTDGKTWKPQDSGDAQSVSGDYGSLAFGAGNFVTVDSSSFTAFRSPNGSHWTKIGGNVTHPVSSVGWDGEEFILFSDTVDYLSGDGIHWTPITACSTHCPFSVPIKVGSTWYAIVDDGPSEAVGESTDLTTFTLAYEPPASGPTTFSLAYHSGQFIVSGHDGLIATSPDGVTWTPQTPTTTDDIGQIYCNGAVCIAMGTKAGATSSSDPAPVALYSTDAINWTETGLPMQGGAIIQPTQLTVGKAGTFVGVDDAATVMSADGVNWILN